MHCDWGSLQNPGDVSFRSSLSPRSKRPVPIVVASFYAQQSHLQWARRLLAERRTLRPKMRNVIGLMLLVELYPDQQKGPHFF